MCSPRRLPGSWQQAVFLGLSPPSSCPFILSLPSEKAEKDHTVGRLGGQNTEGVGRGTVYLTESVLSGQQGRHTLSQERWGEEEKSMLSQELGFSTDDYCEVMKPK